MLVSQRKKLLKYLQLKSENNVYYFEVRINNLTLEDLIALKLELACSRVNNRLYGLDIWKKSGYIIKEALLKFAISTTQSKKDAARFLGLTYVELKQQLKRFDVETYFKKES